MKAMILEAIHDMEKTAAPLRPADLPVPRPGPGEVLIEVSACGVCHTEIDEIEGRTPPPRLPVVPGHQVVGCVVEKGSAAKRLLIGDRVGVAWIYSACGKCDLCRRGFENLCDSFRATGRDVNGGYAEYMVVDERFAYPIPDRLTDVEAAPLLCAGAIGYRSLALSGIGNGQRIGLTGFGASAHLVLKLVRHLYPDTAIHVFARSEKEQRFAIELGAVWSGHTDDVPPQSLHAIIDTTPAWRPVIKALEQLLPGGRLVINAIRKESRDRDHLLGMAYERHLWMEKEVKSVANVARSDVEAFLAIAANAAIRPEVQTYPLEQANRALQELKQRKIRGAKVLVMAAG